MARTRDADKHPALLAKKRHDLAAGVINRPGWTLLSFDQQRFLAKYMIEGDAYAAGEGLDLDMVWVGTQMENQPFRDIMDEVREFPKAYVQMMIEQRLPQAIEELWIVITTSKNENTRLTAIDKWVKMAGMLKGDLPPGATLSINNYDVKMFGTEGNRPPPSMKQLREDAGIDDHS